MYEKRASEKQEIKHELKFVLHKLSIVNDFLLRKKIRILLVIEQHLFIVGYLQEIYHVFTSSYKMQHNMNIYTIYNLFNSLKRLILNKYQELISSDIWSPFKPHNKIEQENNNKRHKSLNRLVFSAIPRGLTARIAGFHPAGPGSTPGVGRQTFSVKMNFSNIFFSKSLLVLRYTMFSLQLFHKYVITSKL